MDFSVFLPSLVTPLMWAFFTWYNHRKLLDFMVENIIKIREDVYQQNFKLFNEIRDLRLEIEKIKNNNSR